MHRLPGLTLCLVFLLGSAPGVAAQDDAARPDRRSPLSVKQIMQEPDTWVGAWPSDLRWGEQGEALYFAWNPGGRFESDSLYRVFDILPRINPGDSTIKQQPERQANLYGSFP